MILIGSKIKELRKKYRYTQTELAEKVGVTKSTIAAYENDSRRPSYEVLIRISRVFNVSLDYILLGRSDSSINTSELTPSQINVLKNIIVSFKTNDTNL